MPVLLLLLFLGDLLGAETTDASQNNNIQGGGAEGGLVLHSISLCAGIKGPWYSALLIFIHIDFAVCFWMHLYQEPSEKESVFFKKYLTVVDTAEMLL